MLELGCGTGRIASALVEPGRRVVGLEIDAALFALARRKAPGVELMRGDMRSFDLDARFDRIIVPFTTFYCLLTRRDALACLKRVRRHLAPKGLFAFDAYAADGFHADSEPSDVDPDADALLAAFEHRGRLWNVFERSTWHKRRQRLDVTYTYRSRSKTLRIDIPQRYLLREEVAPLLERAGLRLTTLRGGFRNQRYTRHSELLVVTAKRAD